MGAVSFGSCCDSYYVYDEFYVRRRGETRPQPGAFLAGELTGRPTTHPQEDFRLGLAAGGIRVGRGAAASTGRPHLHHQLPQRLLGGAFSAQRATFCAD